MLSFESQRLTAGTSVHIPGACRYVVTLFLCCRSHATYYFIAAGCYISVKNFEKAQELLDKVPELMDKRKIGGKDLPTEVFIKKKRAYSPRHEIR